MATSIATGDWVRQGAGRPHVIASIDARGPVMACGERRRPTVKMGAKPALGACLICDRLDDLRGGYTPERATGLTVPAPRPDPNAPAACDCGCDRSPEGMAAHRALLARKARERAANLTAFESYLAEREGRNPA